MAGKDLLGNSMKLKSPINVTLQGDTAETVRKVQLLIFNSTGIKVSLPQTVTYIIKNHKSTLPIELQKEKLKMNFNR